MQNSFRANVSDATSPAGLTSSRLLLLLACVASFLLAGAGVAGASTAAWLNVLIIDGGVALLWCLLVMGMGWMTVLLLGVSNTGRRSLRNLWSSRGQDRDYSKILDNPLLAKVHWSFLLATAMAIGLGIASLITLKTGQRGGSSMLAIGTPVVASLLSWGTILAGLISRHKTSVQSSSLRWFKRPVGWRWLWIIPAAALGWMSVGASIMPAVLWKPDDPHPYDVMSYHLQVPRQWYELGRIVPLHENVFSYSPFNAEMQSLLLMHLRGGPWAAIYSIQHMSVIYTAILLLGLYGTILTLLDDPDSQDGRTDVVAKIENTTSRISRLAWASSGQSVAVATLVVAVAACVPWVIKLGSVAYEESMLMMFTGLACGWALIGLRWINRSAGQVGKTGETLADFTTIAGSTPASGSVDGQDPAQSARRIWSSSLQLAGFLAGLACGVKYPAVPMVLGAILLGLLLTIRGFGMRWQVISQVLLIGGLIFSPWLIRNYNWTHNPVFPLAMNLMGHGHFTPEQVDRFNTAHQPPPDHRGIVAACGDTLSQIAINGDYGAIFWPAVLLAGIAGVMLSRKTGTRREIIFLLIVIGVMLVVWIGFTHRIGRFFVVGIPPGCLLLGLWCQGQVSASTAMRRLSIALPSAVLAVLLLTSISRLSMPLSSAAQGNEGVLVGLRDFTPLMSEATVQAVKDHRVVVLVGDAQAFLAPIPMSQLSYKTVFDVQTNGRDAITAWTDGAPIGTGGRLLLINVDELSRLSATYKNISPPPANFPAHGVVELLQSPAEARAGTWHTAIPDK